MLPVGIAQVEARNDGDCKPQSVLHTSDGCRAGDTVPPATMPRLTRAPGATQSSSACRCSSSVSRNENVSGETSTTKACTGCGDGASFAPASSPLPDEPAVVAASLLLRPAGVDGLLLA